MTCAECGGTTLRRPSGFHACRDCGKLVIAKAEPETSPVPTGNVVETVKAETDEPIAVPDYMGTLVGWRAWGVYPDADPPLLQSLKYAGAVWTPGERMEATCGGARIAAWHSKDEGIPGNNCGCGLYAAKTREHLQSMNYHRYDAERRGLFHVMGEVELWGRVVEGTQGWRAEFGYPRTLYVPFEAHRLVKPLRDSYGCKVKLNNILKHESEAA